MSIYWFSELNFYVRYTECTVYFTLYIFYLKRLDQKIFEPVIIWDRETGLFKKILKNNDSQNYSSYSIIESYYFYSNKKLTGEASTEFSTRLINHFEFGFIFAAIDAVLRSRLPPPFFDGSGSVRVLHFCWLLLRLLIKNNVHFYYFHN